LNSMLRFRALAGGMTMALLIGVAPASAKPRSDDHKQAGRRGAAAAQRPAPRPEPRMQPRMTNPKGAGERTPVERAPLGVGLKELSQLPPEQRTQRLMSDPSFQKLPPQRQRQMLKALDKLNALTPEQQQRVITRMHDLGELNPEQRQGLEQIFNQFQMMTPDRRQAFRAAYNNLRQLPPEQREMRMSRPQFQARFSPAELDSLHRALDLNLPADVVGARPNPNLPPI
jgi:hypothetical protein